ncbi:hypothetical protein C8F04DRAFT_1279579 [Mycena alexandri]|uniref:Uncharacterized protein n=1 Tax=Mycena alexandri TaxID=1745969 RepID=A0AAD6WN40_9AGAR|nr:hypothetical protein C8F04DRAFT_1279579 [Mycena alexandri]
MCVFLYTLSPWPISSGLGYRGAQYKPTDSDYKCYEAARTRLLLTERGEVALRSGGLIARIASDVVSIDRALLGPSDRVTEQGVCFRPRNGSVAFWDEKLTEDEENLICGVYYVATGQRDINKPKNRQLTIRSWWPRPSAFVGSALEVGWWSPACEAWYQTRLRQIANRTADLISSVEWKKNLKLERKCIPYLEGVEKCSTLILASTAAQFLS